MNKPTTTRRRWMIWGVLLLTTFVLTAVVWLDDPDPGADDAATSRKPRHALRAPAESGTAQKPVAGSSAAELLARSVERLELPTVAPSKGSDPDENESAPTAPVDLLAARTWVVPPPPAPPVIPKAPPLPYKVVGRLVENNQQIVFLANQDRNFIARDGVKLDSNYLVETIEANRMTFIYLPLNERQILNLGAVN